jgi:epsilon-lactone hydrolase
MWASGDMKQVLIVTPSASNLESDTKKAGYANPNVSLRAKLTNALLRLAVKEQFKELPDIYAIRAFASKFDRLVGWQRTGLSITDCICSGVPARLITASKKHATVILYLHGGGFCFHLPRTYDAFVSRLCNEIDANGLIPNYRLAPENPFPAGLDDCFAAYGWLLDQGYAGSQIVVAGDSAGGSLTLSIILKIRDAGLPLPAAAVALSPGTDLTDFAACELDIDETDPFISLGGLDKVIAMYLPNQLLASSPLVSPVLGDFTGFPPLAIHSGSREILYPQSVRAVENAKKAGVDAILTTWKDMPHAHPALHWLPESTQAIAMIGEFFRKHLS